MIIDIRNLLPQHKTKAWKKRKKTSHIFVHFTGSENQDPYVTAAYHIGPNHISKTGCPTLCYHYYLTKDGSVYWCNDDDAWTWHTGFPYNGKSIAVVLAYKTSITPEQYQNAVELVSELTKRYAVPVKNILGHKEALMASTKCPGPCIDMSDFRRNVAITLESGG